MYNEHIDVLVFVLCKTNEVVGREGLCIPQELGRELSELH